MTDDEPTSPRTLDASGDRPVRQLRVVVEVEDFDAAVRFFRDGLGLPEQAAFEGDGDARVVILDAGRATLELANPAQRELIDSVEVGRSVSPRFRLAFEVDDTVERTEALRSAGAEVLGAVVETPWRSLNSRLDTPGDMQITLFQELTSLDERSALPGFGNEAARDRGGPAAVVLRAATDADVEAIARLWHDGWRDGHAGNVPEELYQHRDLAQFVDRARRALAATTVAITDGAVAGFVTVHDDEVEQIYVDRAVRGRGVAAALLDHAEAELATRYELAWLAVVAGNERARSFYAKRGWHDAGPFTYEAAVDDGTFALTAHRYEKRVR